MSRQFWNLAMPSQGGRRSFTHRLSQSFQRWRARQARLRTLRGLDEHILEDIGVVVRGDIPAADSSPRIAKRPPVAVSAVATALDHHS